MGHLWGRLWGWLWGRAAQIELLQLLVGIANENNLGVALEVKIKFNIIASLYDYNPNLATYMKVGRGYGALGVGYGALWGGLWGCGVIWGSMGQVMGRSGVLWGWL